MEANKSQLQQLIKYGETYNLEFKENYTKEIAKEMCAFANATGGKILVGVTDEGKIKGFDRSNNNQSKIQELARNIEPSLDIKLYMVDTVLIIEVPEGLQSPIPPMENSFYG